MFTNNPLIYVSLGLGWLILVYLINMINKTRTRNHQAHEQKLKDLNNQIAAKTIQLDNLTDNLENWSVNRNMPLSKMELKVLDVYDQSNIKIPVEIIEDLSAMRLDDEKEVIDFIETQRHFWRLENTKKVFKRRK